MPQFTNTLVVDPYLSSTLQYGITFCCGHHIKISPLLPPLHIWSSPGNGSLSHRVAREGSHLCHREFFQFHPLRFSFTSPVTLYLCATQSCDWPVDGMLLNYTCSHVKIYLTALQWLKSHQLSLLIHHLIVKRKVKPLTACKQSYEHQGAFKKYVKRNVTHSIRLQDFFLREAGSWVVIATSGLLCVPKIKVDKIMCTNLIFIIIGQC